MTVVLNRDQVVALDRILSAGHHIDEIEIEKFTDGVVKITVVTSSFTADFMVDAQGNTAEHFISRNPRAFG